MPLHIPNLLVVIPAYNEAGCIGQVIHSVQQALSHADILVIDDGSTDNTAEVAESAGAMVVRHPFNLCIGGALQTALKFAVARDYTTIMRVDADGQHNPNELALLYNAMRSQQADVVFGSRFMGTQMMMRIPFVRRLGIWLYATLVSLLTRQRATDTTSGFFCMNRRAATVLAEFVPQDYPEVEGRIILHKSGCKVVEVPVNMRQRMSGHSSIDNWRSLYYALKVSVAVLFSAFKDIPIYPVERTV